MAMISCPECAGRISDQAAACPHCGFPIAAAKQAEAQVPPPREPDSPIEMSGILVAVAGVVVATVGFHYSKNTLGAMALIACVGGVLLFALGRILRSRKA